VLLTLTDQNGSTTIDLMQEKGVGRGLLSWQLVGMPAEMAGVGQWHWVYVQ